MVGRPRSFMVVLWVLLALATATSQPLLVHIRHATSDYFSLSLREYMCTIYIFSVQLTRSSNDIASRQSAKIESTFGNSSPAIQLSVKQYWLILNRRCAQVRNFLLFTRLIATQVSYLLQQNLHILSLYYKPAVYHFISWGFNCISSFSIVLLIVRDGLLTPSKR